MALALAVRENPQVKSAKVHKDGTVTLRVACPLLLGDSKGFEARFRLEGPSVVILGVENVIRFDIIAEGGSNVVFVFDAGRKRMIRAVRKPKSTRKKK